MRLTALLVTFFVAGTAYAGADLVPSDTSVSRQVLELEEGWNLIALTTIPEKSQPAAIFDSVIEDVVIIRDHQARTFVPAFGIDEIVEWDFDRAYQVFMNAPAELVVEGSPVAASGRQIQLSEGWNSVPFVLNEPFPVDEFFNGSEHVVLVKSNDGKVYDPAHGINDIGDLLPGDGYLVYASAETAVEFEPPVIEPTSPADPEVYYVPDWIDATGTADVTLELNEFMASVPDGGVVRFTEGNKYRIDGTLRIIDKSNLTIEGDGALLFTDDPRPAKYATTLRYPHRNRYHVSIEGGRNITLRSLKIRGAHPNGGTNRTAYVESLEAQHGINIYSTRGVLIEDCEISDVYGDFVYIGNQRGGWAEDVHIARCTMQRTGRQGIAITGGRRIYIEDNFITEVRRSVFDLEANTTAGGAEHIYIRGNHVGSKRLTWLANKGSGGNIRHIFIEDNVSDSPMNMVVSSPSDHRRGPYTIVGNTGPESYGSSSHNLMEFRRVDGLYVKDNYHGLQKGRNMYGVGMYDVHDYEISGNDFPRSIGEYINWDEVVDD